MGGHGGHGGGGHGGGGRRGGGGFVVPVAYGYGLYDDDTLDELDDTPVFIRRRRSPLGVIAGEDTIVDEGSVDQDLAREMGEFGAERAPRRMGWHPLIQRLFGRRRHMGHDRVHGEHPLAHPMPKKAHKKGRSLFRAHGEDDVTDIYVDAGDVGDSDANEPNYDQSYTGVDAQSISHSGVDNELALSTGGVDPFAVASFGVDADDSGDSAPNVDGGGGGGSGGKSGSGTQDVGGFTEDLPDDMSTAEPFDPLSMTHVADYWFDPLIKSGRTGTLRHPHVDFGQDFCTDIGFEDDYYSGFNRAPVMGGELSGTTGKMGR